MVPLDSDAVRSNDTDHIPVLEIVPVELEGDPCIPLSDPLDPRRIGRSLQRHDHLLARLLVDEHWRVIRCSARPDQCAFSPIF